MPQNYTEAVSALNDAVSNLRKVDENGDTRLKRCIRSAYHKRGTSKYFMECHEKGLHGSDKEAWLTVKRNRNLLSPGIPYEVRFDPHDGKGACIVKCRNLTFPKIKMVSMRERRVARRTQPLTVPAGDDRTPFIDAEQSRRVDDAIV